MQLSITEIKNGEESIFIGFAMDITEQKTREDTLNQAKEEAEQKEREAQAKIEAAEKAEQQAKEAAERVEREKVEAEHRAKAEQERAVQAEKDRQEQAERERLAKEETERKAAERKAANKKHRAKINNELLSAMVEIGISKEDFKNLSNRNLYDHIFNDSHIAKLNKEERLRNLRDRFVERFGFISFSDKKPMSGIFP